MSKLSCCHWEGSWNNPVIPLKTNLRYSFCLTMLWPTLQPRFFSPVTLHKSIYSLMCMHIWLMELNLFQSNWDVELWLFAYKTDYLVLGSIIAWQTKEYSINWAHLKLVRIKRFPIFLFFFLFPFSFFLFLFPLFLFSTFSLPLPHLSGFLSFIFFQSYILALPFFSREMHGLPSPQWLQHH